MDHSQSTLALTSPAELKERLDAERAGDPILVYRDGDGRQRIVRLGRTAQVVTIGRDSGCDVRLGWDGRVSRLHAELRCAGGEWLLIDDGSRNGTFLNGERASRRRLKPLDKVRIGETEIIFRGPLPPKGASTTAGESIESVDLSPAQRKVLVALCRPYEEGSSAGSPATNREIAEELFLSVPAVKTHLRALFGRFGIDDLPQNEKRARLAKLALARGTVSPSDFRR